MKSSLCWLVLLWWSFGTSLSAADGANTNAPLSGVSPFTNTIKIGSGSVGYIRTNTTGPGSYTVTGGGNDIGGTNDEFTFHYFNSASLLNAPGYGGSNCEMRVRLDWLEPNCPWTKAGLMLRESTNANSRMAYCYVTPPGSTLEGGVGEGRFGFTFRTNTATPAVDLPVNSFPGYPTMMPGSNAWLRLSAIRRGLNEGNISAYSSIDGSNWFVLGSFDIVSLGFYPTNFGLAVSRGSNAPLPTAVAEFRDFASTATYSLASLVLTSIPDQVMDENTTNGPLSFYLDGPTLPISDQVYLSYPSTSPLVVPNDGNHLKLEGSIPNRTLTIIAAANLNESGFTTVTIYASDRTSAVISSFLLYVNFVNQRPTIAGLPPSIDMAEDSMTNILFTVDDVDSSEYWLYGLGLTAFSDNQVFPTSNITFGHTNVTIGGTNYNRSLTLRPFTNQTTFLTAVFDDAAYVDTTSGGTNAESDNVQASLTNFNFLVATYPNIDAIAAATASNNILLFPAQENFPVAANPISTGTRTALSNFVAGDYVITTSAGAAIIPGSTDVGNHTDDAPPTMISLPFPYTLYGQTFTSAWLTANGNVQFLSSNTAFGNLCLPTNSFNYAIFALWDDLHTDDPGGGIFTSVSGAAPDRIFNIEWRTTYHSNRSISANFEVRLYEAQERFDIVYGTNGTGNSATVGVQKDIGSRFTQFECNSGGLSNGLQLTFRRPDHLLIVHGSPGGGAGLLLNALFGFGVNESPMSSGGPNHLLTSAALGTEFAGGPASLPVNASSSTLQTSSLPPGSRSIYETNGQSLVAEMYLGGGKIIFLGWNWWNAAPLGTQDGGWLSVLQSAVHEGTPAAVPVTVYVSDGLTNTSATIAVRVLPVNDPPTINPFTILPPVKGDLPQTISLTGISAGPPDERQGNLTVTPSTSNPALISPLSVTYTNPQTTGTLTFAIVSTAVTTPVTNASIIVTVNDGGTSNNTASVTNQVEIHSTNWYPSLSISFLPEAPSPSDPTPPDFIDEDGQKTYTLTFADSETWATNLQFSVSVSNPACIPVTNIILGPIQTLSGQNSGQRTMTITPLPNQFGTNLISVVVRDRHGARVTNSFVLVVSPVNDPPTLDPPHNMTFVQDSGLHTNYLTGISGGPTNEPQLSFSSISVGSSNTDLVPIPMLYYTNGSTGYLVVSNRPGTIGNTTIAVTLNDGGASSNTLTRRFTVTVLSTNDIAKVAQGSADYINRLFFPSNNPSIVAPNNPSFGLSNRLQPTSAAFYNGHVANSPLFGPFRQDFNDNVQPQGTVLAGVARIDGGFVHLTDAGQGPTCGDLWIPDQAAGRPLNSLQVRWRSYLGDGPGGADGFSFNWGTDLPAPGGCYGSEAGAGTNLSVTVDTFDNGAPDIVGIEILWRGQQVAFAAIPSDNPGNGVYLLKSRFVDVSLEVFPNGIAVFNYDGTVISAALPGFVSIAGGNFLFAAHTAGSKANDNQWIDDVQINWANPGSANGTIRLLASSFGQPVGANIVGLPYLQLGASIDLASFSGAPIINPTTGAFFIPADQTNNTPSILFASQPGLLSITFSNGVTQRYYVLDQPAMGWEPATIYLTDINGTNTRARSVTITNLTVIPHYNSTITASVLLTNAVPGGVELRAADTPGQIVLEYRDKVSGAFSNVQVLIVRDYRREYFTAPSPSIIGNWLDRIHQPHTNNIRPYVAHGLDSTGPSGTYYAYQYDNGASDTNSGRVFATQRTSDPSQIELFWFKRGPADIIWPDEMDRYAAEWPNNLDSVARRIYLTETDDGALTAAPTIDIPTLSVPNLTIHYNSSVPQVFSGTNTTLWLEPSSRKLHARHSIGPILLHYNIPDTNGFIGFQIVDVRPYRADYVDDWHEQSPPLPCIPNNPPWYIGDQLKPRREYAESVRPYVARGGSENPAYAYQHTADSLNPSPMDGFVFTIRETTTNDQVEVFWKRRGLQNIEWPYEMHRYTATWPTNCPDRYQLYVRGRSPLGTAVTLPTDVHPTLMPYQDPPFHARISTNQFFSVSPGWALLKYAPTNIVMFQPIRSEWHTSQVDLVAGSLRRPWDGQRIGWPIGNELTNAAHESRGPGYIYLPAENSQNHLWDRYDWEIYDGTTNDPPEFRTQQIFGVNNGLLEVWWYQTDSAGVFWPSFMRRYTNEWRPELRLTNVIASQKGIPLAGLNDFRIYYQNDPTLVGFNPNDEHAMILPNKTGLAAFPLRSDLGTPQTSEPYLLLKDRIASGNWEYHVYRVDAQGPHLDEKPNTNYYTLHYPLQAGLLVQPPYPLPLLDVPPSPESTNIAGPAWRDRKGFYWAKAAGDDGRNADIRMRWFYPVQAGFYFPTTYFDELGANNSFRPVRTNLPLPGTRFPWLDRYAGTPGAPHDVTNEVYWTNVHTLRVGETLVKSKFELPDISSQISAEIIYQQSASNGIAEGSVKLIDPTRFRELALDGPLTFDGVQTELNNGLTYFPELPPQLRSRFWYQPGQTNYLRFKGQFVEGIGVEEPKGYLLLNVITAREKKALTDLFLGSGFSVKTAVAKLSDKAAVPIIVTTQAFDSLALTAGLAKGAGFVTIAFNNSTNLNQPGDPISLAVIKVDCPIYRGDIKVIDTDNPFDEQLTLRHTGDFAGRAGDYVFQWYRTPDSGGQPAAALPGCCDDVDTLARLGWIAFTDDKFKIPPTAGPGMLDITISGPGLVTLMDNWFICRYKPINESDPRPVCTSCTNSSPACFSANSYWSAWTEPQLAEGWIKRVLKKINPFEQRVKDYNNFQVNTIVSMISQAGPPFSGNIAFNGRAANDFGLIEIYESVLRRGLDLSIDNNPEYGNPAIYNALLLAAGRLADLYMLLGNEAYADAADPTIAFGTDDRQYGSEATSIHCFMNQTSSLLEEELALLRGRGDPNQFPNLHTYPVYNRMIWNFTRDINGGEVAYALNYNIRDQSGGVSGVINEETARTLYPQGHGDAWGHYLSAIKNYYRLLANPNFIWVPQTEAVLVLGAPVSVDYLDERKFAKAAAAKARTGAEIVNLAYRQAYTEDPSGQWQGYDDSSHDRAWGLSEWASRAGQGAFFDWVVGNAMLPEEDTNPHHVGIQKIDRITVTELREIPAAYDEIEAQMDSADKGFNPLGLSRDAISFDIDPKGFTSDQGRTHFEQVFDRSVQAMNNTIVVFNNANNSTQLLRRQADSLADFQKQVVDREFDFTNRLIEIYGYPYDEDIGPGKTYPQGYQGPDLIHFFYINIMELTGEPIPATTVVTQGVSSIYIDETGGVLPSNSEVTFNVSNEGLQFRKPDGWTKRRAPGEIQRALGDLWQARTAFLRGLTNYDNLIDQIEHQVHLLKAQHDLNDTEIRIIDTVNGKERDMNKAIIGYRAGELALRTATRGFTVLADALAEAFPKVFGLAVDVTAPARGAIKLASSVISLVDDSIADGLSIGELHELQVKEQAKSESTLDLTVNRQIQGITNQIAQLRQLVRQEPVQRLDLYTSWHAIEQAGGAYRNALARGDRLLEDRLRFRQQTASQIQGYRYKDMAFRIFRNDALQKYRAQFDLAARYVYLAAKAYDYETCLLPWDARGPGQNFLTEIVRSRTLGLIQNGQPVTGSGEGDAGLADPLARMFQNWNLVLKGQLGFNNPEVETSRFSLRNDLFRTWTNASSKALWQTVLRSYWVSNILELPEFQRYCIPFNPTQPAEPGLVIPFSSTITFGLNFFGWPLGANDSAYDSSHFATKVRGVGVWFANYNNLAMSLTPRVYLIPIGIDILRSPTGDSGITREWRVVDQLLPVPFVNPDFRNDPNWIPINSMLDGTLADIRKYSSFRAYHDGGFNVSEMTYNSRLIGRSVWNDRWMLIIPAGTLWSNRDEALNRFIYGLLIPGTNQRDGNGVSDIKLYFQTYSYSGN